MSSYRYRVVDVFTDRPLEGNALAVFPDATGMDGTLMQRIAKELNLSETSFVLPSKRPDCVANVRIFTPTKEMLFAGHPTVGTSFILLQEGVVARDCSRFALEEKIGAVPIQVETGAGGRPLIWLTTPPIEWGKTFDAKLCAQVLGLTSRDLLDVQPQLLSAGNPVVFIAVKDKAAVDRAWLDLQGMSLLKRGMSEAMCVFVFTPTPEGAYSRMFAPEYGIVEDPATGSATGPLGAFMIKHALCPGSPGTRLISEQGTKMGRRSILHIRVDSPEQIAVGGYVTPLVEATLTI